MLLLKLRILIKIKIKLLLKHSLFFKVSVEIFSILVEVRPRPLKPGKKTGRCDSQVHVVLSEIAHFRLVMSKIVEFGREIVVKF